MYKLPKYIKGRPNGKYMKDVTLPFSGDHLFILLLMVVNWAVEIVLLYMFIGNIFFILDDVNNTIYTNTILFTMLIMLVILTVKNIMVDGMICEDNRDYQSNNKRKLHNSRLRYIPHYYLMVLGFKKLPIRLHLSKENT